MERNKAADILSMEKNLPYGERLQKIGMIDGVSSATQHHHT